MKRTKLIPSFWAFILLVILWVGRPAVSESVAVAQDPGVERSTKGTGPSSKSAWVPPFGPSMEQHGWRFGTFQSETAQASVGYYCHLPPNYESDKDRRYPVVYWLHGLGVGPDGADPVVTRLDAAIKAGAAPAMILVSCTDPTKRSFWTDSKDGRVSVETVIVQDLIPHIDATFRTIATREGRAIEGHSMGGYGAAYLGFKYPDTFGAVSILAGALRSPEAIVAKGGQTFQTVFGGDARYTWACSPWVLVQQNADRIRGRTFVRIHVGDKDGLRTRNAEFHEMLAKLRIDHTWSIVPNTTHNPEELFANWPGNPFEFYATTFATSVPAGSFERGIKEFVYKRTSQGGLKIHIRLPDGWTPQDKRPAIVFFFGGRWRGGSVEQFRPQAQYLAQRGMVAARVDYRVWSRHGTTADKCVEDARSAVRWLRANAVTLGVDPERIVACGDSAGGHLAACTSGIAGFDAQGEDISISCCANLLVLFDPVLNCESMAVQFGTAEIARRVSPNLHLSGDIPPTLILCGGGDGLREDSRRFVEKATELGIEARMYVATGRAEGFFSRSAWFDRTTFLIDEFLAAHGYLEGKPTIGLPAGGLSMTRHEPSEK